MAIFFMILGNFLANYKILPAWLWHAPWNGFTIADLGVPIFLFAIGISYELSFSKRIVQYGKIATVFHFLKRYLILFMFGFGGFLLVMGRIEWEVLQMIGAAGIFALGFMFLKPKFRVLIALALAIVYQLTILNRVQGLVLKFAESGLGGPYATPSWGFILLFGSALANWISGKGQEKLINTLSFWASVLTLLGILLSFIIPFNKHLVSISYVLFTTGIAIGGLLLFYAITKIWHHRIPVFDSIGRNGLICYITSQILTVIGTKLLLGKINVFFFLQVRLLSF